MNIEISEETGNLLRSALAAGTFSSADALIAAMVRQSQLANGSDMIEEMQEHVEVDQLAQEQGVGPVRDFRDLRADFWPEGESIEAFLAAARDRPAQDMPRARG